MMSRRLLRSAKLRNGDQLEVVVGEVFFSFFFCMGEGLEWDWSSCWRALWTQHSKKTKKMESICIGDYVMETTQCAEAKKRERNYTYYPPPLLNTHPTHTSHLPHTSHRPTNTKHYSPSAKRKTVEPFGEGLWFDVEFMLLS